jgi:hypothetical protein
LNQEIENSGNVQGLSNQMLEHKANLIQRSLGTKLKHLKSEIEAPTVWGAMAMMLECIDDTPGELPNLRKHGYSPIPAEWTKRMVSMDANLMDTASTLSKAMQAQGHRIDTLQKAGEPLPMLGSSAGPLSTVSLMGRHKRNEVRNTLH